MKSFKSVFTKAACMFVFASAASSFTVSRAQVETSSVIEKESPGTILFVSTEGDMLVFDLRFQKLPPKGSLLRILDGDNNIIFEEKITTEVYNRRYKIVRNDISKINFEISDSKFYLSQSFNVNTKVEETVEVTKA